MILIKIISSGFAKNKSFLMFLTAYYSMIRGRTIHKALQTIVTSGSICVVEGRSPSQSETGSYVNTRELLHSVQHKNLLRDLRREEVEVEEAEGEVGVAGEVQVEEGKVEREEEAYPSNQSERTKFHICSTHSGYGSYVWNNK
jgi:hypothetical protein